MKILFVVSLLSGGGAERVLSTLANRWSTAHDVTVVTLGKGADFYPLVAGVRRVRLDIDRTHWFYVMPYFKIVASLRSIIREHDPDFVVSFVIKTNIFTLLSCMGTNYPVIACEHSVINRDDIDGRVSMARRIVYPLATKIGLLTDSIREEFIAKYPSIPHSRIVVIPNPIDLQEARNASFIVNGKTRPLSVISLGRLIDIKNFESLIRAFAIVVKEERNVRLTIYGEGPCRPRLEGVIKELGLEETVALPGIIENVQEVYAQADIFAITSRFEGMPMALLESMCSSLPSVGFDTCGVRDFLRDGYNGISVPFGDIDALAAAMNRLFTSPEERVRLGKNAREFVRDFSPERIDDVWFNEVFTL